MVAQAGDAVGAVRWRARRRRAVAAAAAMLLAGVLDARAVLTFTPPGFVEETVAAGLPYATAIAWSADGRLFIAQKSGIVRVWRGGSLLPEPFVDLSVQVNDNHDRGLLGLALHPDFPATPYVYLLFTYDPPGAPANGGGGRVARLVRVEADPAHAFDRALPGMEAPRGAPGGAGHVVLLGANSTLANIGSTTNGRDTTKASCMTNRTMSGSPIEDCIPSDENSHTIGTVAFGPDGSLFVGAGDGSNYGGVDPRAMRAQLLDSLAGKVLRVDPDTGAGLPDNPFFDPADPQRNRSKLWARGLRNPFRFSIDPRSGEPFIGDVGWNGWEEIDTGKGANFGWPCYEGGLATGVEGASTTSLKQPSYETSNATKAACKALYDQGLGVVRAPLFAYSHSGTDGAGGTGGASANAGAIYTGDAYPAEWQGALFVLDYNRRWIRALRRDGQGNLAISSFAQESTDGPVQAVVGPDSNLYLVIYSGAGSEVRRIRYVAGGNTPPTAVASATPSQGQTPLHVDFSSLGSFDPDAQTLVFSWDFGDGAGASGATAPHTYTAAGVYHAVLTATETTPPFASATDEVLITVGHSPPIASIDTPPPGTTYQVGDTIAYAGSATEAGAPVDPALLSWEMRLHHNQHVHFDPLGAGAGGEIVVDEHGDQTWIELCLTVTLPGPLVDVRCVDLQPRRGEVSVGASLPGVHVVYEDEGVDLSTPAILRPIVGSTQTVTVDPVVQLGLSFDGWEDGPIDPSRTFLVSDAPLALDVRFVNRPPVALAVATPVAPGALEVAFDGTGSSDPEGAALAYAWDLGDGATSSAAVLTHVYAAHGAWQASLVVTDAGGASDGVAVPVSLPPPDADGDGVPDASDVCPFAADPGQSDTGGVGSGSPPDGVGDACQCGDVNGDGRVTLADAVVITRSLLAPPTATPARPELCDVGGGPSPATQGCTLADAVILRSALIAPPAASIAPDCAPAHP